MSIALAGTQQCSKRMVELSSVTVKFPKSFEQNLTVKARLSAWREQFRETGRIRKAKEYFRALEDVDLVVREGEVVGVIGRNGSGKSTLLRTIAGIYEPDLGRVQVRGRISMLLSLGTGLNNNLSGRRNIYMMGHLMGMSRDDIEEKIDDIIEYASLGDFIDVPVRYYSSGMISRLGFSIAASMDPNILLVDEVFSVGDLAFRQKSERTLRELLARAQCQIIVTHNLEFVRNQCNRAIQIRAGRLVDEGPPGGVVDRYCEEISKEETEG